MTITTDNTITTTTNNAEGRKSTASPEGFLADLGDKLTYLPLRRE